MKLANAKVLGDILLAMKINRIADKDAKKALTKSFLSLRKAVKEADEDREEIARKFREDWAEEIRKSEHSDEYVKAENEANESIRELYDKDVDIQLSPVDAEVLYEPSLWGEDDTLGQIENSVEFLILNGIATQ